LLGIGSREVREAGTGPPSLHHLTAVRQRIGLLVRRKLFVLWTSRGQRAGTWPAGQL